MIARKAKNRFFDSLNFALFVFGIFAIFEMFTILDMFMICHFRDVLGLLAKPGRVRAVLSSPPKRTPFKRGPNVVHKRAFVLRSLMLGPWLYPCLGVSKKLCLTSTKLCLISKKLCLISLKKKLCLIC